MFIYPGIHVQTITSSSLKVVVAKGSHVSQAVTSQCGQTCTFVITREDNSFNVLIMIHYIIISYGIKTCNMLLITNINFINASSCAANFVFGFIKFYLFLINSKCSFCILKLHFIFILKFRHIFT